MPQADREFSTPPETYEPYATPDGFCEALPRIERIGACRGSFLLSTTVATAGGP
jgi:hypothetical protein